MITIENVLNSKGFILQMPVGNIMWPMLHNKKEQLVIQKISRPLKTNDVVLLSVITVNTYCIISLKTIKNTL